MAFQLPKINLADAKTRVVIIFSGVIGFVIVIYAAVYFLSNKTTSTGASRVANAPGGLQSVPGGQLTPEYYRALVQANEQAAKQAKISGGSAVPTLLNESGAQPVPQPATSSCTIVCPTEENVDVENDINELMKAGKLSATDGKDLIDLAKKNVAVSEYSAHLNKLVKQGKLSPEQARKLLDDYRKQHENALLRESGSVMDGLIKSGRLPIDTANELLSLQKKHVSPAEYAAKLDELVSQGKISPDTARELLDQYSQQRTKEATAEAVGQLEQMAASGQIPPDVARELGDYVKRQVSPKAYDEELQHLVKQGRLTPEQAQRLSDLYKKQQIPAANLGASTDVMKAIVKEQEDANEAAVRQLAREGKISAETAQKLLQAQQAKVPVEEYKRQLDGLVREGKLAPEDAQKLLVGYARQKGVQDLLESGKISAETAGKLLSAQQANMPIDEYKRLLEQLIKAGKISPAAAQKLLNDYQGGGTSVQEELNTRKLSPEMEKTLLDAQNANVPVAEYKKQLDDLARAGKISPAQAQRLLQDYEKLHAIRDEADRLDKLRANNVPVEQYADELKQAVAAGILTPAQATQLLKEYQDAKVKAAAPRATAVANVAGGEAFAELQRRVQASAPTVAPPPAVTQEQFGAVATKNKAMEEKAEQERIQTLMNAMSTQAGQLISSWQPPVMAGQVGSAGTEDKTKKTEKTTTSAAAGGSTEGTAGANQGVPLIKAGTIIYAVLDTAINSDFPDSPVLATIVDGKYKGAKLLGKIAVTKDQDRVGLTFKLMNMDDWPSGKTINAYAIDPDTARSALASNVNYHYFLRYGGLFASSFLQGYASAINNSGSTTSSGIFGTTTTRPNYSPSSKIMTGLGQVGQTFGQAIAGYTNTPPTVKIDPGVSLGILFMQDVMG